MGEDKKEQSPDMVVGNDGSMTDGEKVEVKVGGSEDQSRNVNELTPPPAVEETAPEVSASSADTEISSENMDPTQAGGEAPEGESVEVKQPPSEEEKEPDPKPDGAVSESAEATDQTNDLSMATAMSSASPSNVTPTMSENIKQTETQTSAEHPNNKKLAVIMVFLVALLLAGGAVYLYISAQSNTEESSQTENSTDTEQQATPATADDVNQAVQDVDSTIQAIDDTADFSDQSLSDQSLGL